MTPRAKNPVAGQMCYREKAQSQSDEEKKVVPLCFRHNARLPFDNKLNDLICGSQSYLAQTTSIRIKSQKLSFYNTFEDSKLNGRYSRISMFREFFGVSFKF